MPDDQAAVVHKSFDIKAISDQGEVSALISTFGLDRDGDVMTAQAFARSAGKSIPMVWSHNWDAPVGKGSVSITDEGAVYSGQFFMDTAAGAEAYKTVKAMGDLQQYSIGFRILADAWSTQTDDAGKTQQVRTITDLELFEASPVLVGAAYGTRTLAIKSAATEPVAQPDPDRADVVTLGLMLVDITRIQADVKAGRTQSAASLTLIDSIMQAAAELHGAMPCGDNCPMAMADGGQESALADHETKRIADARADIDRALAALKR